MSVFELETGDSINAYGAGFQPVPATNPDAFDSTATGPDRFTIWIPSEQVAVNLGNPVHGATAGGPTTSTPAAENTSAVIQIDRGFVAQTDNHIHFHTFGIPTNNGVAPTPTNGTVSTLQSQERTVVRLGTPTTVPAAGTALGTKNVNSIGSPTAIGSVYPTPYNMWPGYVVLTEGGSYQESSGTSALISGTADVRLAGNTQALLGSPGAVQIAADSSCAILDFAQNNNSSDLTLANDPQWLPDSWSTKRKTWKLVDTGFGFVTVWIALGLAAEAFVHIKHGRSPLPGVPGWAPASFTDQVFPFIAPALTAGFAIYNLKQSSPAGNVEVYASSSFSAAAVETATIHGELMASMTALGVAQVSGTIATSISSALITSISGGLLAQVTGTMSAKMISQLGPVKVAGLTSAELSSNGPVWVTGKGPVQVNSTGGLLYLHGANGFYLGAGAGPAVDLGPGGETHPPVPGYGIQGTSTKLVVGPMLTAGVFAAPTPDPTNPSLQLGPATGTFGTALNSVAISAAGVTITGTLIQVG
jgi:hypothetical protein